MKMSDVIQNKVKEIEDQIGQLQNNRDLLLSLLSEEHDPEAEDGIEIAKANGGMKKDWNKALEVPTYQPGMTKVKAIMCILDKSDRAMNYKQLCEEIQETGCFANESPASLMRKIRSSMSNLTSQERVVAVERGHFKSARWSEKSLRRG